MSELVVLAKIACRHVAIQASLVQSVIDLDQVVPVPRAPIHVAGVTALRSRALTVIDTSQAINSLGSAEEPFPNSNSNPRAIVVDIDGHVYALMVDEVSDVLAHEGKISAVPGRLDHGWQSIARGMVETSVGPALLIDPRPLVDPDFPIAA